MPTYLVIGASRGIGLALVKQLGAKTENTVIATVRKGSTLKGIEALGYKNIKLVYVDIGASYAEINDAFKGLKEITPKGIDVVIHNAAIGDDTAVNPLHGQDVDLADNLLRVNVAGVLKVYRAIYPRLEENGKPLKYVVISSKGGQITDLPIPTGTYGASKAAANYLVKQISEERKSKGDIVVPINPGTVETDMSAAAIAQLGDILHPISTEESASKILSVVENLTIEDTGKFFDYDGQTMPF